MRRIINLVTIFFVIINLFLGLVMSNNVYATEITIDQIVEKFNDEKQLYRFNETLNISDIKASSDENKIIIKINFNNGKIYYENWKLNGNILSLEIDRTDVEDELYMDNRVICTAILIDIIGQLYGYGYGDLMFTFLSDKSDNYTIEEEGIERGITYDGKAFIVKVDITKKIPLADFSDTYITVNDLEDIKDNILDYKETQLRVGNIQFYYMEKKDGKEYIMMAESGKLTENTYKSILSVIEVMFEDDSTILDYFMKNYSSIDLGNKEFNGFNIEVNSEGYENEVMLRGKEIVIIEIDKQLAIDSANNTDTSDIDVPIPNIKKLPRTGNEINGSLVVLYVMVLASSIGLIAIVSFKNGNK